jgi:hypothetical protein
MPHSMLSLRSCLAGMNRSESTREFVQPFIASSFRTRVLDAKWGRLYDQLFEDRQEGDYVVLVSHEVSPVKSSLRESQSEPTSHSR